MINLSDFGLWELISSPLLRRRCSGLDQAMMEIQQQEAMEKSELSIHSPRPLSSQALEHRHLRESDNVVIHTFGTPSVATWHSRNKSPPPPNPTSINQIDLGSLDLPITLHV